MLCLRATLVLLTSSVFGVELTYSGAPSISHGQQYQQERRLRKTPDTRVHPGVIDLPLPKANQTLHLIRCRNHASAYSAAWLAPKDYVLRTNYANRATLEWHSHNLYQANAAGSYKLEELDTFFVNHISEYEHTLMRHESKYGRDSSSETLSERSAATLAEMVSAERERACNAQAHHRQARTQHHTEIAGIIPFYPGAVGDHNKTGNAHSVSSSAAKASWLRVVACSLSPFMSTLLVGTCSREHAELARTALGFTAGRGGDGDSGGDQDGWPFPATHVEVAELSCELPVHLPYVLLRNAQARLSSPSSSSSGATPADKINPRLQRARLTSSSFHHPGQRRPSPSSSSSPSAFSQTSSLASSPSPPTALAAAEQKTRSPHVATRRKLGNHSESTLEQNGGGSGGSSGRGAGGRPKGVSQRRLRHHKSAAGPHQKEQEEARGGAGRSWKGVRFLYFTEMDNALHVSDHFDSSSSSSSSPPPSTKTSTGDSQGGQRQGNLLWDALIGFLEGRLGPTGYVSPNRFNKKIGTSPRQVEPQNFNANGQNKCNRD